MSDYLENIENYINGLLSNSEKAQFESQLESDEKLKLEFEKYQLINQALELDIENDLKQYLNEKAASDKSRGRKTINLLPRLSVAAIITLMICAGIWWSVNSSSRSDFIHDNYVLYENSTLRNSSDESIQDFPESTK